MESADRSDSDEMLAKLPSVDGPASRPPSTAVARVPKSLRKFTQLDGYLC